MGACLCKSKRRSGLRALDQETEDLTSYEGSSSTSASIQSRLRSSALLGALSLSNSRSDLSSYISQKFVGRNHSNHSNSNNNSHNNNNGHHRSNSQHHTPNGNHNHNPNYNAPNNRIWSLQNKLSVHADRLVIDTLESIRPTVLNEPSNAMQKLNMISETEIGWLVVVSSIVNKVDIEHPFGSALILLILEEAPLPTKKSINQLNESLSLGMHREQSVVKQRNISIVLGCLAEKLAGTLSSVLFSKDVQDYLLSRIEPDNKPIVILYSLIALEKFSQTTDNKLLIVERLNKLGTRNPLLKLELLVDSQDFIERQVGFCSRWDLDNHFLYEGRPYSYETVDKDNLNVILNSRDASENLKISPDGLTARNDTSRFESVRCTYAITSGVYYYEVLLITPGVMQIGFATKQSKFLNHDGFGIGDDDQSFAYDGCRQLLWQNAKSIPTSLPRWKEGDIVGCLIDLEKYEIRFSLNGKMDEPSSELFRNKPLSTQYYGAASFMPFQHCQFNFGRVPFVHPPEQYNFRTFNQCASLTDEEKTIIPRHLMLRRVHYSNMMLNTCTICCDNAANVKILPCDHNGFCEACANLLDLCPLCRITITERKLI